MPENDDDKILRYSAFVFAALGLFVGFFSAGIGGAILGAIIGFFVGFFLPIGVLFVLNS